MGNKYTYDVFLSHAVEDKFSVADELNWRLYKNGLKVWYLGTSLGSGVNLEEVILNEVIPQSRYVVALVSETYLTNAWTKREFTLAANLEICGENELLPVLCGVSSEDVMQVFELNEDHPLISLSANNLGKTVRQVLKHCR